VKIALKIQFANIRFHQVYACILQKQSKQKIQSDSTITFSDMRL